MITRACSGDLGACQAGAVDKFACATQKLWAKHRQQQCESPSSGERWYRQYQCGFNI